MKYVEFKELVDKSGIKCVDFKAKLSWSSPYLVNAEDFISFVSRVCDTSVGSEVVFIYDERELTVEELTEENKYKSRVKFINALSKRVGDVMDVTKVDFPEDSVDELVKLCTPEEPVTILCVTANSSPFGFCEDARDISGLSAERENELELFVNSLLDRCALELESKVREDNEAIDKLFTDSIQEWLNSTTKTAKDKVVKNIRYFITETLGLTSDKRSGKMYIEKRLDEMSSISIRF